MQYPSQAMAAFQPGMVPTPQAQQQQQQQVAAGRASQAGMAMQQHGSQQQMRQPAVQQPGYSPATGSGMYAEQGGMQQQAGRYPGMAQAYPTSAAEQLSRPMSPPGLPRGPSQPATASQRSQIKSPSGQFLGPQMIRPAMATNPMVAHQMAGNQMVGHHMMTSQMPGSRTAGNQMVGNTVSSPKAPSAMQPASLQSAVASGSNGMVHAFAQAQAQAGPQASNSASSRPNSASSRPGSASSQEGTGGSGQSDVMPQSRAGAGQADVSAPQAAVRYPSGQVGLQMQQAGYGASAYGLHASYPSSSQPSMMHGETPLLLALPSAYALANHTMLLLVWYLHRPCNAFVTSMYCYYCRLFYWLFADIDCNPEGKQCGMFKWHQASLLGPSLYASQAGGRI